VTRTALIEPEQPWRTALLARPSASLGPGLLLSYEGLGVTLTPSLKVSYPLGAAGWFARAALAASVFGTTVQATAGSGTMDQQVMGLELGHAFGAATDRIIPMLWVQAGAYHLRASGSASPPFIGQIDDAWALQSGLGGAIAWRLAERFALTLDGHALFLAPEPIVVIASEPVARAGQPLFMLSLAGMAQL